MNKHICASLVPIFQHLDDDDLKKIASISIHKLYKKGDIIFRPQQLENLLILVSGSAKVYTYTKSGKEQLLRVLECGDFIGEESLFGLQNQDWCEALSDLEICSIGKLDFQNVLTEYPSISFALLKEYHVRLQEVEKKAGSMALEQVGNRLAYYLLDLAKAQHNRNVKVPLMYKELASVLGTTPESLSRKMKEFEDKDWIQRTGKQIKILEYDELVNME